MGGVRQTKKAKARKARVKEVTAMRKAKVNARKVRVKEVAAMRKTKVKARRARRREAHLQSATASIRTPWYMEYSIK